MSPTWFHGILLLGLGLLIGLEMRAPAFRVGANLLSKRRRRRARRNLGFLIASLLTASILRFIQTKISVGVEPALALSKFGAAEVVLCVLFAELIGYAFHWVKHESELLWRFHFQHHRESQYDMWLTAHTHALEVIVSGSVLLTLLVWVGFSPFAIQSYLLFYTLANTYQHSSFQYSLGWLDKIIVSPGYHRLHHAVDADGNYGNTITFWDIVFRTARWPKVGMRIKTGIAGAEPYGFLREFVYFAAPRAPASENKSRVAPSSASSLALTSTPPA